jgi:hypothetical protein
LQQIISNRELKQSNVVKESKEIKKSLPNKISDSMFQELLKMEGDQSLVAEIHKNDF